MKILSGTSHFNEEVTVASETVGDTWLVLAQPIVVRDADIVDLGNVIHILLFLFVHIFVI